MKKYILTVVLLSFAGFVLGQEVPDILEPKKDSATVVSEKAPVYMIEQTASFPGGDQGFYKFISIKLQKPELATLFGFKGRIVVEFTVGRDGFVKDIHAFSDSGLGYEEEVMAAISKSPRWKPATQNGRPVEESFTIPFKFDLLRATIDMNELKKSSIKFTFKNSR